MTEENFMTIRQYDEAHGDGCIGFSELELAFLDVSSQVIGEVTEYLGYLGANIWLLKRTTDGQRYETLADTQRAELQADKSLSWQSFMEKYKHHVWSQLLQDSKE